MKFDSATYSLSSLARQSTAPDREASTERLTSVVTIEKPQPVTAERNQTTPLPAKKRASGAVFGSTFLTIFLAEFGDKTQLSTLLMSAESQSPGVVFLGAAAALIATSLLGVLLGQWLANRLAPKTLKTAAGVSLLFVSLTLLWDIVQF